MTEKLATDVANGLLEYGLEPDEINHIVKTLDYFGYGLRQQIAEELDSLETPSDISSDWYAASRRTKMAAIAIVKHGLSND
jgi:hypothetical protein